MRRPVAAAASSLALIAAVLVCDLAWAQEGEHSISLDIYAFSQGDDGGDEYREEGFDYFAWALEMRFTLSEWFALELNGTLGYIVSEPIAELPDTVTNRAELTGASEELLTLDTAATLVISPPALDWRFSPSFYFHHQHGYLVLGGDLGVAGDLADGDTALSASYGFRIVRPVERSWQGHFPPRDRLLTHNVLFGWTQTLSPSWIVALGLQYTRQDGLLHSTLQYVTLFDEGGAPVELIDEVLPRVRNRFQVNARARYTPLLGLSVGLASSFYADDWGILHGAVRPSVELPLTARIRWQLWYRLSLQSGVEHHEERPTEARRYRTQDSDLMGFSMHSPGTTVTIPLGGEPIAWTIRVSGYGFYRGDDVYGGGATMGVLAAW